ncbi:MAG: peptidase [Nitrospira sp. CR1.3]|nr:peptidase [Nitrospira sp. CR1.3]
MTFCLGMKVEDGLVGIADTRVTTGVECITARKVSIHQHGRHSMFLMTSGLRSVRDKAVTYFDEAITESDQTFDKLFKAVNVFATQIRRVAQEDKEALDKAGLTFNLHALVGGQLENDQEHKLYLIYPQGNWVEVSEGTPYCIIGESGYGKPLLDRVLRYHSSMDLAMKVGFLAFDATRTSSTSVEYPIDVVLYRHDTFDIVEHRFEKEDLAEISSWWQSRIYDSVEKLPSKWSDRLLESLPKDTRSSSNSADNLSS